QEFAVVGETDFPARVETMSLPGHGHIQRAVEPHPGRAPGQSSAECSNGCISVRLHFLTAEGPTHANDLYDDLVCRDAQHLGDDVLGFGWVLRRGVNEQLPIFVDVRQGGLGLKIKVILASKLKFSGEDVLGELETTLEIAFIDDRLNALETFGFDR